MKYCYGYSEGKLTKLAKIFTQEEHQISKADIDYEVVHIIKTLSSHGHMAYVVGGAIRDLLVGIEPKDFDVVTDAHPHVVKRYFRNAQIIGKRFPIVIIKTHFPNVIEVSTFRADDEGRPLHKDKKKAHSVSHAIEHTHFGTILQDVNRRDFTCNALYYDIHKETILDFVEGLSHIRQKKLMPIRALFDEDPVRMIRAIKYSCKLRLKMSQSFKKKIVKHAHLLAHVSSSRICEELIKILVSGYSAMIIPQLMRYKLFAYMLPIVNEWYESHRSRRESLVRNLGDADQLAQDTYTRIRGLQKLIESFVLELAQIESIPRHKSRLTQNEIKLLSLAVKKWLYPITPPNVEVHNAIISVFVSNEIVSSHSWASKSKFRSSSRK